MTFPNDKNLTSLTPGFQFQGSARWFITLEDAQKVLCAEDPKKSLVEYSLTHQPCLIGVFDFDIERFAAEYGKLKAQYANLNPHQP